MQHRNDAMSVINEVIRSYQDDSTKFMIIREIMQAVEKLEKAQDKFYKTLSNNRVR